MTTTALANTSRGNRFLAPSIDRKASDALAAVKNTAVRDYPAAPEILLVPIPVEFRRQLKARQSALEQALAPHAKADQQQLAKAIAGTLGSFGGSSGGSVEAVVAKYLHVLEDVPAWAIVLACQALERGEVDGASLDFRPSAARVRDTARALMAPWREEWHQIKTTLEAETMEPQDEAMRARIAGLFAELQATLRG